MNSPWMPISGRLIPFPTRTLIELCEVTTRNRMSFRIPCSDYHVNDNWTHYRLVEDVPLPVCKSKHQEDDSAAWQTYIEKRTLVDSTRPYDYFYDGRASLRAECEALRVALRTHVNTSKFQTFTIDDALERCGYKTAAQYYRDVTALTTP